MRGETNLRVLLRSMTPELDAMHYDIVTAKSGVTAAFASALGQAGISANVIAGYHHDHIFVQWDKRHDAMSTLTALSKNS